MANPATGSTGGVYFLPRTRLGRAAVVLGLCAALVGLFLPRLHTLQKDLLDGGFFDGRVAVSIAVAIGLVASAAGLRAVIHDRERAVLLFVVLVPLLLVTLFWVVFAAGEILLLH